MWMVRAALSNFHAVLVFMLLILVLGSVVLFDHRRGHPAGVQGPGRPGPDLLPRHAGPLGRADHHRPHRALGRTRRPGVPQVESRSVPGVSVVKLYFRDDIDPNAALTMTNSLALGTLPTCRPTRCRRSSCRSTRPARCRSASSRSATRD